MMTWKKIIYRIMTLMVFGTFGYADNCKADLTKTAGVNSDTNKACEEIYQVVKTKTADPDIHNASVRVTSPKYGLSCAQGYGLADGKSPMTADNSFRAASIGKLFTATAILQLIEEGKLSLDTLVADIITLPYGSFSTLDYVNGHSLVKKFRLNSF